MADTTLILLLILNNKAMWYNKIVMDENNNEILREKYFISEVYELYNGLGLDICGNYIIEYWSEE